MEGLDGRYAYKGATAHQLKIMRQSVRPDIQVKAAGDVRNLDDLLRVAALGVTRVGATATVAILEEAVERGITNEAMTVVFNPVSEGVKVGG